MINSVIHELNALIYLILLIAAVDVIVISIVISIHIIHVQIVIVKNIFVNSNQSTLHLLLDCVGHVIISDVHLIEYVTDVIVNMSLEKVMIVLHVILIIVLQLVYKTIIGLVQSVAKCFTDVSTIEKDYVNNVVSDYNIIKILLKQNYFFRI